VAAPARERRSKPSASVEFDFLPATHFIIFSAFIMEHMRLGVFERARLIAGAQPFSTWLLRLLWFLIFWHSGHLGIDFVFSSPIDLPRMG
jgi:hypothetical protein